MTFPQELHVQQLENGITVLADINQAAESTSLGIFVRNGARDEYAGVAGISHFIEHLLFKGTESRTALELTYAMADLGVQANAFTSEEETLFYGALMPGRVEGMLEILSDMLHPKFGAEDVEMERKVIMEEIAQYDDRPQYFLFERALRDFFGDHPAGNSVLGTCDSISGISRECVLNFFRRRYCATNLVIAAAGKLDWRHFVECCERHFLRLTNECDPRPVKEFRCSRLVKEYRRKDLHQGHILFLAPGPSARDELRYAALVLSVILGDSTGSRLYWDLVETGLAESASMETDEREDIGAVSLYAVSDPDSVEEVSERLESVLRAPLDFENEDLRRAKKKLLVRVVHHNEIPMGRLLTLGGDFLFNGRIIPLHEHLEKIQAVTVSEIEKLLVQFPLENVSRFTLLPE